MLVAIQLSVLGLYLPPVFKPVLLPLNPPQTIISLVVHTAVCQNRPAGALAVLVAAQLSVPGLYLPPVFSRLPPRLSSQSRSTLPCDRVDQQGRWLCWWRSNSPCCDCIFRQYSYTLGDNHPIRSFRCPSKLRCAILEHWGCWSCWWLSNYQECIQSPHRYCRERVVRIR